MALIKKFRIKSYKNNKPLVKLQNISLAFGNRKILENISFNIDRGSILGLLGPNGVGKSTIFNLIMGLIKPDYGKILFDNQDATSLPVYERATKFSLGFCPQKGGFFGDIESGTFFITNKRLGYICDFSQVGMFGTIELEVDGDNDFIWQLKDVSSARATAVSVIIKSREKEFKFLAGFWKTKSIVDSINANMN